MQGQRGKATSERTGLLTGLSRSFGGRCCNARVSESDVYQGDFALGGLEVLTLGARKEGGWAMSPSSHGRLERSAKPGMEGQARPTHSHLTPRAPAGHHARAPQRAAREVHPSRNPLAMCASRAASQVGGKVGTCFSQVPAYLPSLLRSHEDLQCLPQSLRRRKASPSR